MPQPMHDMLTRQLKRHLGNADAVPPEWMPLIHAVNDAYREFDRDRNMLERSLELSSEELLKINADLRQNESLLIELTTQVPGVVYQFYARSSGELGFYYISDKSEQIIGLKADLDGYLERLIALIIPEHRDGFIKSIEKSVKESTEWKYEWMMQKPSGERIWLSGNSAPTLRKNEIVFNGIVQDITEHNRAEDALRKIEARFSNLVAQSPLSIQILDTSGKTLQVNRAFENLWGVSFEQMRDYNILEDDQFEHIGVRPYLKKVFSGEAVDFPSTEFTPRTGTVVGHKRVVQTIAYPLKDESGAVREVTLIHQDISDRKRTEDALRESEEKHRLLIENSHDIIYMLTTDGVFTFVSPAWTALLGHPTSQVIGQSFQNFVHPDDIPGCMVWLQKVIEMGQRQEGVEYRVRHANGSWYWHTSSAVPLRDEAGKVIGFEGTARDISERKKAEKSIQDLLAQSDKDRRALLGILEDAKRSAAVAKQEKDFNKTIIDSIPGAFYMLDAKGQYVRWNAYQRDEIVGKPEDQVAGTNAIDTIHPDDRALIQSKIANVLSGNSVDETVEGRVLLRGGPAFRWLLMTGWKMTTNGNPFLVGIGIDVTERKLAEEKLRTTLEEIQLSNRLMAGREERVLELKKEINDLLAELGRPVRFRTT